MERTPLHYSNLLFGGSDDTSVRLINNGAQLDVTDVLGRVPSQYRNSELSTHEYTTLYKDVINFESTIVLREMAFDVELNKAITYGDLQRVKQLTEEAGSHANMATFSPLLFDCVDQGHPDIAMFLLKSGCDPDIWKQYEQCDPTDDLCIAGRCHHPVVSLYGRCKDLGYKELAEFVDELKKEKLSAIREQNHAATAFQLLANYGLPL